MKKLLEIFSFFIIAILLVSCTSFTRNEQTARTEFIRIENSQQVGQTFLSRFDGLQGISVFLKPIQADSGEITLNLFSEQISSEPIHKSSLLLTDISTPGFYTFTFPPLRQSTNQDYFFNLSINEPGVIETGSAPGNSYLSGAQYIDGLAQNSQSAFRLDYAPGLALWGLIQSGFNWFGFLIVGLLLLSIPGTAALMWLYPLWSSMDWISKLGLTLGIGLAFYPVLFLWTDAVGIQLGRLNALLLPLLGTILIVIKKVLDAKESNSKGFSFFGKRDDQTDNNQSSQFNWANLIPDLVFLVIIAFIVFTRFWPVRNLDAPMWGDSYQHTMITQLLVDNGGLFTNWEPYAQLGSFTYHFGFHSIAASMHWLTNLDIIQTNLWTGQLLNIFAIIALYPLAVAIGKNRWAGVIAVLIAGLISPMPMLYANWGRYTQLAGQIILPAIIVVLWSNLNSKQVNLRWQSLVWFGLAGLALTHYRVTIFMPLFYVSYFLFQFRKSGAFQLIKRIVIHLVGVVILLIPWIMRIFEGSLPDIFGAQISTAASQVSQASQQLNSIGNITSYLPFYVWVLLLFSIIWGVWKRNRESNIFIVWWLFILLAANPQWLRLPGTGILTNFAVFIAAYIPTSVMIGSGLAGVLNELKLFLPEMEADKSEFGSDVRSRNKVYWTIFFSIIMILISIWFVRPRTRDIRPMEHALLTRPDVNAGMWINQNLSQNAKFLVNSFFAYGGTLVVGSDGGWWLPLITTRQSSQPPLTYGSETGLDPGYVEFTNSLVALIEEKGIDHPDVLAELEKRGFTHIYLGQQQGQVNANSPPLLDLNKLMESPNFELIYNQDRVRIFNIVRGEG
ncbi:MAG: hypothetical protein JSV69_07260 [Chloroflexota bacterium]|nr:MAG: hypothetical protein JSV69_07260 [Chloroflexota bacterium]